MQDLFSLVYVSTASRQLDLLELSRLQASAQRRNAREGVSGVLLYADGNFMQCLEGPAQGLARVYDVIRSDALHYGIVEIVRERIAVRQFSEWSMAFRVVGAFACASPDEQDALLMSRLAGHDPARSPSCRLLANFWNRGRRSTASELHDLSHVRHRRMAAGE